MPSGPLSDARLRALVEDIRDDASAVETDAVEWKRSLDFSKAESRFALPKNILGMANRLPEVARRSFEGFGYVLVGVEHGSIEGVTSVDVAQLHNWIDPNIGATGPNWQPRYVTVGNAAVLAIEVDPPRAGDRIHALRKECVGFQRGTIFVRKNGMTRQADDQDVENLEQRSKGARLELDLQLIGADRMSWFDRDAIEDEITRVADHSRGSQISQARSRLQPTDVRSALQLLEKPLESIVFGNDPRTFDEYMSEVEDWHVEWNGVAPQHWLDRYMLTGHGGYSLRLDNLTDQNFADVEVRLRIAGVSAEDEIPSEAVELPTKPEPFGRGIGLIDFARVQLDVPVLGLDQLTSYEPPDVYAIQRDGAVEIVWEVGHLRPAASVESDALCILVDTPQDAHQLEVDWSATSTNVNGVMESTLSIPLAERRIFLDDIEHDLNS